MRLRINLPNDLTSQNLVRQKDIPCVCKVSNVFELELLSPHLNIGGIVEGWSANEIAARVPAGGGGRYTHVRYGLVTLQESGVGVLEVRSLSMFYEAYGWLPVVAKGYYATPHAGLWDEEDE